ncbi:hypothetical protein [Euzebya tangerina]|uniref:hypothetical protein n=1 Tax=Euzebya tangerina TaxID=591198 RepID=UPI000E314DDA|nr:hypothetical protein [Euzebya tangerina]
MSTAPTPIVTGRTRPSLPTVAAAANVLAAGVPGALLTIAPEWATTTVLGSGTYDGATSMILGAIWLAIGVVSAAAIGRPELQRALAGVFAVQSIYKSVFVIGGLARIDDLTPTGVGLLVGFVVVIPLLAAAARRGLSPAVSS